MTKKKRIMSKSKARIDINYNQAQELVRFFGGDSGVVAITDEDNGHSGPGLYLHFSEYPDEGSHYIGDIEDPE